MTLIFHKIYFNKKPGNKLAFDDIVDEGISQNALQIGRGEGEEGEGILHFGIRVLNWF